VEIATRQASGGTVVDVIGDITLFNSPQVRSAVLAALRAAEAKRVILNLKQVRYIDSSGVASLVEGLKASRDTGIRLALVGLSPAARQVLELTRLLKLFEVHESEEQALSA
jgi:anti-sigma B factor antagonist